MAIRIKTNVEGYNLLFMVIEQMRGNSLCYSGNLIKKSLEVYLDGNNNFIPSIAGTLATCKTGYNWKGPSVVWESISPSGERVTIRSKRFYDPWGDSGDSGFLYFEQLELRFFPNGLTKDYEGYR